MIPYLGCESAREMLERLVDAELSMADQVVLESHLRWCRTCAARVEDMRLIGASIRLGSPAQAANVDDTRALAVSQSEVLTRIRAERAQSFPVRFHEVFEDMRFLWPALGATVALVACLFAAMTVHRASRAGDPESMANMIETLAKAAADRQTLVAPLSSLSSYYPVQLDALMLAPRTLNESPALDSLPEEEAVFAVDAVVTREGRVANYALLQSERAGVLRGETAARTDEVDALLDAVKRSRFEPAQAAGGGAVTVRVVWVLARTTVKAQAEDVLKPLNDGLMRPAPRPARS